MKEDVNRVEELGNQIGYGHLMNIASALWRKSLKEKGHPESGAFVPTCLCFVDKELAAATKAEREMYDKIVNN